MRVYVCGKYLSWRQFNTHVYPKALMLPSALRMCWKGACCLHFLTLWGKDVNCTKVCLFVYEEGYLVVFIVCQRVGEPFASSIIEWVCTWKKLVLRFRFARDLKKHLCYVNSRFCIHEDKLCAAFVFECVDTTVPTWLCVCTGLHLRKMVRSLNPWLFTEALCCVHVCVCIYMPKLCVALTFSCLGACTCVANSLVQLILSAFAYVCHAVLRCCYFRVCLRVVCAIHRIRSSFCFITKLN